MTSTRSRHLALVLILLVFAGGLSLAARAQSAGATPPAAERPRPCGEPERRQFDFWLGDWDVRSPQGELRGRNLIESIEGGCALRETYSTPRGYSGTSLNFYDAGSGRWRQTWIDNQGAPLHLSGGASDSGAMVLSGEAGGALQRITWTPLVDGRVRQLWESSGDGGASWTVAFDGYYSRRE